MMADAHDDRRLRTPLPVAHRPGAQRGGAPLPPLVHALDARRPGADRRLLRVRRLDLGRLLRHARRPHGRLRGGRALRGRRAGRRPDDVLRPRLERLELHRAAHARAGAAGRADPRRPQLPPLHDQRDQGVRARLPLPALALRRRVRGGAAAVGRPGRDRRCGATPRRSPSSTPRRPTRACARTRTPSPPRCTTRPSTRCCSSTRRGAGTCTSTPSCRRRRWTRAPTSPSSRRTSSRAGSSRPA